MAHADCGDLSPLWYSLAHSGFQAIRWSTGKRAAPENGKAATSRTHSIVLDCGDLSPLWYFLARGGFNRKEAWRGFHHARRRKNAARSVRMCYQHRAATGTFCPTTPKKRWDWKAAGSVERRIHRARGAEGGTKAEVVVPVQHAIAITLRRPAVHGRVVPTARPGSPGSRP